MPLKRERQEDDDEDDYESSEDEDSEEMRDFIVDDESESEAGEEESEVHDVVEPTFDHIDTRNIVQGRRTRRPTRRYEDEVFNTEEYRRMMLCDIPQSELNAALYEEVTDDETDTDESASEQSENSESEEEEKK